MSANPAVPRSHRINETRLRQRAVRAATDRGRCAPRSGGAASACRSAHRARCSGAGKLLYPILKRPLLSRCAEAGLNTKSVWLKPQSPALEPLHVRSLELDLKRDIGRSIAEVRDRRGLTQNDLAVRLGCSIEAIASLERGQSFPRFRILFALARELRVPLRDLVDPADQVDPSDDRRARLEFRGRALLNQLSNDFLEIAIEQLSVLAKRDLRSGTGNYIVDGEGQAAQGS
jgi:transcriptional regulator with XRE-family HTH domain